MELKGANGKVICVVMTSVSYPFNLL